MFLHSSGWLQFLTTLSALRVCEANEGRDSPTRELMGGSIMSCGSSSYLVRFLALVRIQPTQPITALLWCDGNAAPLSRR